MTRFDQFQRSLDISASMLTRRLNAFVEADLLERRRYCERPPTDEYIPTEKGKDFWPVLCSLLAWGNKHFVPEGPSVVLVDRKTGRQSDPVVVDRKSGKLLTPSDLRPTTFQERMKNSWCRSMMTLCASARLSVT